MRPNDRGPQDYQVSIYALSQTVSDSTPKHPGRTTCDHTKTVILLPDKASRVSTRRMSAARRSLASSWFFLNCIIKRRASANSYNSGMYGSRLWLVNNLTEIQHARST